MVNYFYGYILSPSGADAFKQQRLSGILCLYRNKRIVSFADLHKQRPLKRCLVGMVNCKVKHPFPALEEHPVTAVRAALHGV
jgi:hypothetical protein